MKRKRRKMESPACVLYNVDSEKEFFFSGKPFGNRLLHHRHRKSPAEEKLHKHYCDVRDETGVRCSLPDFHYNSLFFKDYCCRCNSCARHSRLSYREASNSSLLLDRHTFRTMQLPLCILCVGVGFVPSTPLGFIFHGLLWPDLMWQSGHGKM